jgi:hypothetical protein
MNAKKNKSSNKVIALDLLEHAINLKNYAKFCNAWDRYRRLFAIIVEKVDGARDRLSDKSGLQWKQWIKSVDEEYSKVLPELDDSWNAMKPAFFDKWKNIECRFCYMTLANKVESYETCESLLDSRTFELRDTEEFRGSNFDPYRFHDKIRNARLFPGISMYNPKAEKLRGSKKVVTSDKYVFRRKDENYFIRYENEEFELRITVGLEYIQRLLMTPYDLNEPKQTKFTPMQLYKEVNKVPRLPNENEKDAIDESFCEDKNLTIESSGEYADIADELTKKKIKELECEIEIAETTGNEAKAEKTQSELDEFKKEYINKKILGKGGKNLKFASALHKKPYDSISQAKDTVYKKIEKISKNKGYNPMLTLNHLKKSIEFKDSHFFYNPESIPNWQF